jgi:hypothetical protein
MSKSITLTFPHSLPKQEARRRIDEALGQVGQQLTQVKIVAFRQSWQGDRANFLAQMLGQEVSGHVDVAEQTVTLDIVLPTFLALIADVVKGRLQSEGRRLLAKNAGS